MSREIPSNRSRLPKVFVASVRAILRKIAVTGRVTYGPNLRIGRGATVNSLHGLEIGHNASVGQRSVIEVDGKIGNFCLIGRGVQIIGRADHDMSEIGVPMAFSQWVGDRQQMHQDAVEIGDDVWIGGGAVVLGGVRIGEGAVIGAGAVVANDVEPYGIAVGSPARVVRLRFDSDDERAEHSRLLKEHAWL